MSSDVLKNIDILCKTQAFPYHWSRHYNIVWGLLISTLSSAWKKTIINEVCCFLHVDITAITKIVQNINEIWLVFILFYFKTSVNGFFIDIGWMLNENISNYKKITAPTSKIGWRYLKIRIIFKQINTIVGYLCMW